MNDNGDVVGHCAWPQCPGSKGDVVPLLHNCTICSKPMFCDQECYWNGIEAHMDQCDNREHIHKQLHQSSSQLVTPRSAQVSLFDLIHINKEMSRELFLRVKQAEHAQKQPGILVMTIASRSALCSLLNWTKHPTNAILSSFVFVSCSSISTRAQSKTPDKRSVALMNACELRVVAVAQQKDNDVFVAVIYDEEEKRTATRLFTLPPLNRIAAALSVGHPPLQGHCRQRK